VFVPGNGDAAGGVLHVQAVGAYERNDPSHARPGRGEAAGGILPEDAHLGKRGFVPALRRPADDFHIVPRRHEQLQPDQLSLVVDDGAVNAANPHHRVHRQPAGGRRRAMRQFGAEARVAGDQPQGRRLGRVNRSQLGIHLHQLGLVLRQQETLDGKYGGR